MMDVYGFRSGYQESPLALMQRKLMEELVQDPAFAERFRNMVTVALEAALPETANTAADKTLKRIIDLTTYSAENVVYNLHKKTFEEYMATPEAQLMFSEKMKEAVKKLVEQDVLSRALKDYVSREIGEMARSGVQSAIKGEARKAARQAKKVK